jgi:hypothetical protein
MKSYYDIKLTKRRDILIINLQCIDYQWFKKTILKFSNTDTFNFIDNCQTLFL